MAASGEEDWGGFSGDEGLSATTSNQSAVIDMSSVDNASLASSFEDVSEMTHRYSDPTNDPSSAEKSESVIGGLGTGIGKAVADQLLQSSRQQARKMFDVYGNIDILRPYFDVEPKVLVRRIVYSFVPVRIMSTPQKIPGDLYGPLMTVFTLVAILLMTMKASGTVLQQGTLMGTALGMCFGYWFGVSGFMYFLSYLCNTYISIVQCLSLLGYGMISHCVILLLGHVMHYSHTMFYLLWMVVAGGSATRMITVLLSRTVGKSQRLLLCTSIACLHMLFLLYLHFAYHQVVEIFIDTIEQKPDSLHPFERDEAASSVRYADSERMKRESLITETALKKEVNESLT